MPPDDHKAVRLTDAQLATIVRERAIIRAEIERRIRPMLTLTAADKRKRCR